MRNAQILINVSYFSDKTNTPSKWNFSAFWTKKWAKRFSKGSFITFKKFGSPNYAVYSSKLVSPRALSILADSFNTYVRCLPGIVIIENDAYPIDQV